MEIESSIDVIAVHHCLTTEVVVVTAKDLVDHRVRLDKLHDEKLTPLATEPPGMPGCKGAKGEPASGVPGQSQPLADGLFAAQGTFPDPGVSQASRLVDFGTVVTWRIPSMRSFDPPGILDLSFSTAARVAKECQAIATPEMCGLKGRNGEWIR